MALPQHAFLSYHSDNCPNCESDAISAADYSWVRLAISITVTCDDCGAWWTVDGRVTGYSGLEVEEQDQGDLQQEM